MKSLWRVYINPFDDFGNYTGYVEITKDVLFSGGIGDINMDLDNTQYDIGVYRYANFSVGLRNDHGLYSDVGIGTSLFKYKRSDSLIKVTWEIDDEQPYVGVATSESGYLSEEKTLFTGLISDDGLTMDLSKQTVSFTCLGKESILGRVTVNYGSLSNGQLFSEVLYTILNQSVITSLLTVSNANITCGLDQTIDDISGLQNKTVEDAIKDLLLASNSVLYVKDDVIYINPRTPQSTVGFNLYGQASSLGPENIVNIQKIRNGLNKTFNYFTFKTTTLVSQDATSVLKYGARTQEISFDFMTNNTKRQNTLDALKSEFYNPKQEFEVTTPMNFDSLAINLLDRISIDYPPVLVPTIGNTIPICGIAVCGECFTPKRLGAFYIDSSDHYKVLGKSFAIKDSTVKLRLRNI